MSFIDYTLSRTPPMNIQSLSHLSFNSIQRVGIATTLIVISVLTFLHNPFNGYITTYTEIDEKQTIKQGCTQGDIFEAKTLMLKGNHSLDIEAWNMLFLDPLPSDINSWPLEKKKKWQQDLFSHGLNIWNRCVHYEKTEYEADLPISAWTSKEPIIFWLASVANLLTTIILAIFSLVIWILLLRTK